MNSFKSIAKGGWHPEGKSSSPSTSSSRSGDNERFKNFKGLQQVANWTGHGTKSGGSGSEDRLTTARPLTSLKDPNSFGAPPRRDPKAPLPPPTQASVLGGETPPPTPQLVEEEEPPRPRGFQMNTTGISTAGLPAPPKRALGATISPPGSAPTSPSPSTGRMPPPLPGRAQPPPLPSRQPSRSVGSQDAPSAFPNVTSPEFKPSTAAASARLGKAGISVPGFNIGSNSSPSSPALPSRSKPVPPPRSPTSQETTSQTSQPPPYSIGELSSRFSSLKTQSPSAPSAAEGSSAGTTWAQKQAALKTASQFRKDPSNVSLSDATSAAKTADNFRQRHGDTIADGYKKAESSGILNSPPVNDNNGSEPQAQPFAARGKWGDLASRASKTASTYGSNINNQTATGGAEPAPPVASPSTKKKPPPPPKPKPKDLGAGATAPPPVPLGTKPK